MRARPYTGTTRCLPLPRRWAHTAPSLPNRGQNFLHATLSDAVSTAYNAAPFVLNSVAIVLADFLCVSIVPAAYSISSPPALIRPHQHRTFRPSSAVLCPRLVPSAPLRSTCSYISATQVASQSAQNALLLGPTFGLHSIRTSLSIARRLVRSRLTSAVRVCFARILSSSKSHPIRAIVVPARATYAHLIVSPSSKLGLTLRLYALLFARILHAVSHSSADFSYSAASPSSHPAIFAAHFRSFLRTKHRYLSLV